MDGAMDGTEVTAIRAVDSDTIEICDESGAIVLTIPWLGGDMND